MELLRKKNQASILVFPLLTSGSDNTYYTTSAWSALTNRSVSAYSWSDDSSPSLQSISNTPSQLSTIGLWQLSATASELNPNSGNHDYLAIKLKADQIKEQTILVILTNYSIQDLANTSNQVVSNNVVNPVITSAYQNFPQVQVSGLNDNVITSDSIADTSPITSADFDTDYYNKIDLITDVTIGDVKVSAVNGGLFIGTSAYSNFPQVYASAVGDKINYSISGTKKLLDDLNDIDGTGLTIDTIPQVYVSGMSNDVVVDIQSGLATSGNISDAQTALTNLINALNNLSISEVQTILGITSGNTIDELTAVSATPSLAQAIMLGYMQKRNKLITNSSTGLVETYNDAGTKVFDCTVTDDGTVFTKDKMDIA